MPKDIDKVPTLEEITKKMKNQQVLMRTKGRLVNILLDKGLKAGWSELDFVGFMSVMASLHKQTKDWEFPSSASYMTLDPKSLVTLIICLEEKKAEK